MRLRFTIRDLFWLTALIAMAVGWWLDHRRIERIERWAAGLQKKNELLESDRRQTAQDLEVKLKENQSLKQQVAGSIK
jgi:hypothetical protein